MLSLARATPNCIAPLMPKDNGRNDEARAQIMALKTGTCEVCSINLYGADKMPDEKTFPCNIEGCPYG